MTDDGCGENSTWTQLLEGISPPLFHFHARKDHLLPTLAKRNGGLRLIRGRSLLTYGFRR